VRIIYVGEDRCPCIDKLEDFRSKDHSRIKNEAIVMCDCDQEWIFRTERDGKKYWIANELDPLGMPRRFYV
jgi:hypothetical protein